MLTRDGPVDQTRIGGRTLVRRAILGWALPLVLLFYLYRGRGVGRLLAAVGAANPGRIAGVPLSRDRPILRAA